LISSSESFGLSFSEGCENEFFILFFKVLVLIRIIKKFLFVILKQGAVSIFS